MLKSGIPGETFTAMSLRSKFYGITFPAFGLLEVPFDWRVKVDTIEVQKQEFTKWHYIDKFDKNKTTLQRYLDVKDENYSFDVTCLNMTHLITKKIKWIIDANSKIYNLSNKQKFKARNVKIRKVRQDVIWVDTVSYPFKIKKGMIDSKELLNQYVTIVYIDNVWFLYRFTSFSEPIESILL
jgi:hypothetical protein